MNPVPHSQIQCFDEMGEKNYRVVCRASESHWKTLLHQMGEGARAIGEINFGPQGPALPPGQLAKEYNAARDNNLRLRNAQVAHDKAMVDAEIANLQRQDSALLAANGSPGYPEAAAASMKPSGEEQADGDEEDVAASGGLSAESAAAEAEGGSQLRGQNLKDALRKYAQYDLDQTNRKSEQIAYIVAGSALGIVLVFAILACALMNREH